MREQRWKEFDFESKSIEETLHVFSKKLRPNVVSNIPHSTFPPANVKKNWQKDEAKLDNICIVVIYRNSTRFAALDI